MSSTSDPIRRWRRRTTGTWLAAAPALLALAAWAVVTPAPEQVAPPDLTPPASDEPERARPPFDLAAFNAPLWTDPPPPPAAEEAPRPPPPPPPVTLQLLAVVRMDGSEPATPPKFQAAIYDPDTDRLHFAADGQRVGRFTVVRVEPARALLRDGDREAILTLDTPESAS